MILRDGFHLHEGIGAQQIDERGWYTQHLDHDADTEQDDKTCYPD